MHHCESIAVLDECRVLWNGLVDRVFDELPGIQSEYQRRELILDAAMPIGGDPHSISRWVHRLLNAQIDENHVNYQDSDMYEIDEMSADNYELSEKLCLLTEHMKDIRKSIVWLIRREIFELNYRPPSMDQIFLGSKKDLIPFMLHVLSHPVIFHCDHKVKPLDDGSREFSSADLTNITTFATEIQYFAAKFVAMITSDDTEYTQEIYRMGCVPALMRCLSMSTDREVVCMCLKNLCNLSEDCEATLQAVRHSHCMDYISSNLDQLRSFHITEQYAYWVFLNLCYADPPLPYETKKRILPSAIKCFYRVQDWTLLSNALWLYDSMLGLDSMHLKDLLFDKRQNRDLIRTILNDPINWITPILRILSDITSGLMNDSSNHEERTDLSFASVSILASLTLRDNYYEIWNILWHNNHNNHKQQYTRMLELLIIQHPSSLLNVTQSLFEILLDLWNINNDPFVGTEICLLLSNLMIMLDMQSSQNDNIQVISELIETMIELAIHSDVYHDQIQAGVVLGHICEGNIQSKHARIMVKDHRILHVFYHLLVFFNDEHNHITHELSNEKRRRFCDQILVWMGNLVRALEEVSNDDEMNEMSEARKICEEEFGWTKEMVNQIVSLNDYWKWVDTAETFFSAVIGGDKSIITLNRFIYYSS